MDIHSGRSDILKKLYRTLTTAPFARYSLLGIAADRSGPPRDDVPLPTAPPYTAFIGNLAFDLTESELESFFTGSKIKSIKIIKDRDDKPKGFGYVEFEDLDGLKDALGRTGSVSFFPDRGVPA